MDTPVSAFSVYKTRKNKQIKKRLTKKQQKSGTKKSGLSTEKISNNVTEKLKTLQPKRKITKNKVKNMSKKKKTSSKQSFLMNNAQQSSESEDIPQLIPAINNTVVSKILDTSESSCCSSNNSFEFTPVETDSSEEGLKTFKWMIAPYNVDEFLKRIWEKKPLHISRNSPKYYKDIISTPIIDKMLRNENIQYTKNIDITSYVDGQRQTHNPEGRAHPSTVWDSYLNGCSIRLLNPQTYIPKLHLLNATLQEFFNSFVGANAYLTPPDSQGFAPHYDDIEAFILQVEGKKHWRIYKPLTQEEVLPRVSSKNFSQDEIGAPIMEMTLEAGDMLYFPRGYIHQGITVNGEHSLHVTISMYQKHSWADLFEKLLPAAVQTAINENVQLRRGLPFDIYNLFGLVNSDVDTSRKTEIREKIFSLFDTIKACLPIDAAVDQMAINYQQDALPPVISDLEKSVTVHDDCNVMTKNGKVINRVELSLDTRIRLLRRNILRMVTEEESLRLYYYAENSLEYHGSEVPYIEIDEKMAPGVETLLMSYPEYVSVENLDVLDDSDKLQLADSLWERGLIMTEYPLETIDDSS